MSRRRMESFHKVDSRRVCPLMICLAEELPRFVDYFLGTALKPAFSSSFNLSYQRLTVPDEF